MPPKKTNKEVVKKTTKQAIKKTKKNVAEEAKKKCATNKGKRMSDSDDSEKSVGGSRGMTKKPIIPGRLGGEKVAGNVVTPDKGKKIFIVLNKATNGYVQHKSKQAAISWVESANQLDPSHGKNFMVLDFPSESALTDHIDNLGKPKKKAGTNPMAGRSAATATGKNLCQYGQLNCVIIGMLSYV